MPLVRQELPIPLTGGLNTAVDDRVMPPGSFTRLRNYAIDQAGTLVKRHGYVPVTDPVSRDEPLGIFAYRSEYLTIRWRGAGETATGAEPFNENGLPGIYSRGRLRRQGFVSPVRITKDRVVVSSKSAGYCHQVCAGEGRHVFWQDSIAHYDKVLRLQQDGGELKIPDRRMFLTLSSNLAFRCNGTLFFRCTPGGLYVQVFGTDGTTVLVSGTIGAAAVETFDACNWDDTKFVVLFRCVGDPVGQVNLYVISRSTLALVSATTLAFGLDVGLVAVSTEQNGTGAILCAAQYWDGATVKIGTYRVTGAPNGPLATVGLNGVAVGQNRATALTVLAVSDNTGRLSWTWVDSNDVPLTAHVKLDTQYALSGAGRVDAGCLLSSRLFERNEVAYCIENTGPDGEHTALVCTDTNWYDNSGNPKGVQIAYVCHSDGYWNPYRHRSYAYSFGVTPFPVPQYHLPYVQAEPTGTRDEYLTVVQRISNIANVDELSDDTVGVDSVSIDFDQPLPGHWVTVDVQGCKLITGGQTSWFDGERTIELGFIDWPKIAGGTIGIGTGTLMGPAAPGTYVWNYAFHWEWFDAQGNVHRSRVAYAEVDASDPAYVAFGPMVFMFTAYPLGLSVLNEDTFRLSTGGNPTIGPYLVAHRTLVNSPGPFYRLVPFYTGGTVGASLNDCNNTISFQDERSDAAVQALGYGFLYCEGDRENYPAPPSHAACLHRNRVWLVSSDDPRVIWYSAPLVANEAPRFSPELTFRVDQSPDAATALASLDDLLIVFTRSAIYAVAGDGPPRVGATDSLSVFPVATDVGCLDSRSIVVYPNGVLFQGPGGFYEVARGAKGVKPVGQAMQQIMADDPDVRGAVLDRSRGLVIWCVRPSQTVIDDEADQGLEEGEHFIVFDYTHGAWFTWRLADREAGAPDVRGHCLYNGVHLLVDETGVLAESREYDFADSYLTGSWVTGVIETPWLHLSQIGGFQRVWRTAITGERKSPCDVTIATFRDDDPTSIVETKTWSTDDTTPRIARLQLHHAQQRCRSIRLRLTDAPSSTDVAPPGGVGGTHGGMYRSGLALSGILLQIGVKQGADKVPAASKK